MKKLITSLAIIVFGLVAFASGTSETKTAAQASNAPTTIQMWYHISPDQAKVLLTMLDEFQTQNPKIKVETQSIPFAELKRQLSVGVAANQLPDITLCDTVDNAAFAAMGVAIDITSEVKAWGEIDKYFDGPRNSVIYKDRYYGVPYYSNCLAIMYNKDIFDRLGIAYPTNDWTWKEFRDLVKRTTTKENYGLTMSLFKSEEGTFNVLPFIWQAGADYDKLDSTEAIEAVSMIDDFYQKGYMSRELVSMTQADMCAAHFATGKSAMMVAGSWLTRNIKNENPKLNYGVVTFAKNKNGASPIGGGNLLMLRDTNKAAAWELMKFLSSKKNQLRYCEATGYIPPRKDSADEGAAWNNDPIMKVYKQQLEVARARGPHSKWPQISGAIQVAVQETLAKVKTPANAMQDAAAAVAKIKQ
ncbi:MAG: ABC transporter substrate-binding protein [Treponemataceae bacterium]